MVEIWKVIPDYEGIYEASNLGRIRTSQGKTTFIQRHGVRHWKQRILKPKKTTSAYGRNDQRVDLWKNGKHKTYLVARLVASAFFGKSNLTVNHIDGNPMNNQISNLEYVSLADNIRKGYEIGLYTNQVAITIIRKNDNQVKKFHSLAMASRSIGRSSGYISDCLIKGKYENNSYRWCL